MRVTMLLSLVVVACCITLAASAAAAQEPATVKDLLAKGGKQLSKEEVVGVVSGATISGDAAPGWTFENVYNVDGTVSGSAKGPYTSSYQSNLFGMTGKWSVDESGKFCQQLWRSDGVRLQPSCRPYFSLDGAYFSSDSSERLQRRVIKR